MQFSHIDKITFDDPNLMTTAGLIPVMALADKARLPAALSGLTVDSPNPVLKATCLIAGMIAGADSIDDLDVLRAGANLEVIPGIRAPSTMGTFLRKFNFGEVRQLDRANRLFLTGLAGQAPGLIAGTTTANEIAFIDLDDSIIETFGHHKQAAGYGYSKVLGCNLLLATLSNPTTPPVILATRLRKGKTKSGRGGQRMLAEAAVTARQAGTTSRIMARADSAFYNRKFIGQAIKSGLWFSVTCRQDSAIKKAIASIPDTGWTPIKYPKAIWDNDEQRWISDAEVAEIPHTCFKSKKNQSHHVACRLIVRRVKRLHPDNQDPLVEGWRYHGFVTNSELTLVNADQVHRQHAVIEQVNAELKANALAHLPSGRYAANAAWSVFAVMAFNLARASANQAGLTTSRWQTMTRQLVNLPARITRHARRLTVHLPAQWPWQDHWADLAKASLTGRVLACP